MPLGNRLLRLEEAMTREGPIPPSASPPPLDADRAARLDELRARIQAVLGREKPRPAPRPRDDSELPFAVERTDKGPLHVRTVRLLPSHRTGRASVLPSRHACPELLSLLALDPSIAACDFTKALYVDTETTGLNGGAGTLAFLVGLAFWEEGASHESDHALVVEQLLLRSPGEEGPILERIEKRIREASMLVSFNGKAFDMPLLRTRFVMGGRKPLVEPPHLDLVHVARRIHRGPAGACKLTAIERRVLGFVREGDVPSGEVSACYLHYLRTGDMRALVGVVEHNAWDVVAMASLVGLYGEPLATTTLSAKDLVGVARTLFRAGQKSRGLEAAEQAFLGGAGDMALLARAEMRKKTGDKHRALADYEAMAESSEGDSSSGANSVNLELAKLYEHFARNPARALEVCLRGTGESDEAAEKRRNRLTRKISVKQGRLPSCEP